MGFLDEIKSIKENKKILFLLGGGALLLIIILLLPAGGEREVELPPGFVRADIAEAPLPAQVVPALAPTPAPTPVAERVFLPPQLLEEAQRRHLRGWGTDPFLLVAEEAEYVRLHLEAIFLGAQRSAIINGKILTIGDKIGGYRLTAIAEGVVTLERNGLARHLSFW